jgi:hypothetical protein
VTTASASSTRPRASGGGADRVLPDGMPMDYILDTEFYCNGFREEQGEEVAEHARLDDYKLDDLVAMYDYAACPLHLHPDYPAVPEGVWKRDYHLATVALDRITRQHTGEETNGIRFACPVDGIADDGCHDDRVSHYHATTAELREVWATYEHVRWVFELQAEDGLVAIHVVGG